jgi:hypothetical protein
VALATGERLGLAAQQSLVHVEQAGGILDRDDQLAPAMVRVVDPARRGVLEPLRSGSTHLVNHVTIMGACHQDGTRKFARMHAARCVGPGKRNTTLQAVPRGRLDMIFHGCPVVAPAEAKIDEGLGREQIGSTGMSCTALNGAQHAQTGLYFIRVPTASYV